MGLLLLVPKITFFNSMYQSVSVAGGHMLSGRQLYLLRVRDTKITDKKLAEMLEITVNDILYYEYGKKEIPNELYHRWVAFIEQSSLCKPYESGISGKYL